MRLLSLARGHRLAGVQQDFHPRADLLAVQPNHQGIGLREGSPVDVTNVVPRQVLAVFLELQRAAGAVPSSSPVRPATGMRGRPSW